MRNSLFVLFLSLSKIIFSQEYEVFYQTTNGAYVFKLMNETCILYDLSPYDDRVYREWKMYPVYSAKGRSDSLGILFSNGQYAISYDYKAGLLIMGAGLLEIGVIGGAITGIVYWVRK